MPGIPVTIIGELYDNRLTIGGGPIIPPTQPPGIWPSPGYPAHPIAPGGPPPSVQHPIVLPPNSIWPGVPAHPIVIVPPGSIWPGVPTHPIVLPLPPEAGQPPGIWPGGHPEHPIVIPPDKPTEPPDTSAGGDWVYSPVYGWVWVPAGSGGKPQPPDTPPA